MEVSSIPLSINSLRLSTFEVCAFKEVHTRKLVMRIPSVNNLKPDMRQILNFGYEFTFKIKKLPFLQVTKKEGK